MKKETKLWLEQAEDDYQTARTMLENHRWGYTCFCSQQVLEKILKAAIIELTERRHPQTHDLIRLAEETGLPFSEKSFQTLGEISRHYFRVRYPDMHRGFYTNDKVARKTFEKAEETYQWVLKKLNR